MVTKQKGFQDKDERDLTFLVVEKQRLGWDIIHSSLSQPQERSNGFVREDSDTERTHRLLPITVL